MSYTSIIMQITAARLNHLSATQPLSFIVFIPASKCSYQLGWPRAFLRRTNDDQSIRVILDDLYVCACILCRRPPRVAMDDDCKVLVHPRRWENLLILPTLSRLLLNLKVWLRPLQIKRATVQRQCDDATLDWRRRHGVQLSMFAFFAAALAKMVRHVRCGSELP